MMTRCNWATPSVKAAGAGLQDVGGLDFKQLLVPEGVHAFPTWACCHFFWSERFAAPGTDDDVGIASCDLRRIGNDAVLSQGLNSEFRKTVVAPGNAHQLRHPANGADVRLVSFFEVDFGSALKAFGCFSYARQLLLHDSNLFQTKRALPDHGRDLVHHGEDLAHTALVKHSHLNALANQRRCNVSLHIGKPKHTVRLQREDFVDLGTGERTQPSQKGDLPPSWTSRSIWAQVDCRRPLCGDE